MTPKELIKIYEQAIKEFNNDIECLNIINDPLDNCLIQCLNSKRITLELVIRDLKEITGEIT